MFDSITMTTLPFVEGNASEYNLMEDFDLEDYPHWTEAPTEALLDFNLIESVYNKDFVFMDNLVEDYSSKDYDSEDHFNWIEVVPDYYLIELVRDDVVEDYSSKDYDSEDYPNWIEVVPDYYLINWSMTTYSWTILYKNTILKTTTIG